MAWRCIVVTLCLALPLVTQAVPGGGADSIIIAKRMRQSLYQKELQRKLHVQNGKIRKNMRMLNRFQKSTSIATSERKRQRQRIVQLERRIGALSKQENVSTALATGVVKTIFAATRQKGSHLYQRSVFFSNFKAGDSHKGSISVEPYLHFLAKSSKDDAISLKRQINVESERLVSIQRAVKDPAVFRQQLGLKKHKLLKTRAIHLVKAKEIKRRLSSVRYALQRLEARSMRLEATASNNRADVHALDSHRQGLGVSAYARAYDGFPQAHWPDPVLGGIDKKPVACEETATAASCEWQSRPKSGSLFAIDSGVVSFVGVLPKYGSAVVIDHGLGDTMIYGGVSVGSLAPGVTVEKGQVVGEYVADSAFQFSVIARSHQFRLDQLRLAWR
jgi:hypothetical protein